MIGLELTTEPRLPTKPWVPHLGLPGAGITSVCIHADHFYAGSQGGAQILVLGTTQASTVGAELSPWASWGCLLCKFN